MRFKRSTPLADRLWARVDRSGDGCWEWQGGKGTRGYGTLRMNGVTYSTHRLAWELSHGAIPSGLHVLHECDNPACCRPDHLFLGTARDNIHDCLRKGRFHHGENTGGARLSEADVRVIRMLHPRMTYTEIGKRYGVNYGTIKAIVLGKTWKHVI